MAQQQQSPIGQQQYGQRSQQGGQQFGGQQIESRQGGQQFGGQGGMQSQIGGGMQQQGQTFEDYLTGDERLVLHDVVKATHTSAWCADLCLDEGPQMATCIRLCGDIEELGSVTQEFIARESVFTPQIVEALVQAAQECAMECERHQAPHCRENASVLHKLVQSGAEYLQQVGGGQQPQFGGQSQMGGRQSQFGGQSQTGGQQPQMGGQQGGTGTNVPIQQSRY